MKYRLTLALTAILLLPGLHGPGRVGEVGAVGEVSATTPSPRIEALFSPRGGVQETIVRHIDSAEREICIAMYSFTSRPLADALLRATERGVTVRLVLDQGQRIHPGSKARGRQSARLIEAGLDLRFEDAGGLLHHKFAVIDGQTLVTGSYNWTNNAETRNAENITVITSRRIAGRFRDEFHRLAALAKPAAP